MSIPAPRLSFGPVVLRLSIFLLFSLGLALRPVAAQTVLRDAETEALLADMSRPLIEAAGLQPENVEIVLLSDGSINAFVAGGQRVFMHSGLILAADNANEVQGVIAHELGHVEGGHIIRLGEGAQEATGISLLSLLVGAAAIAMGAGDAGIGILSAGSRAAIGRFLSYSRVQESSADLAGARYLSQAGISGRGSLAFFRRLQNQEYRLAIPQDDSYDRTHPLSGERISILRELYEADPAWDTPTDPELEARFQRVRAKLFGYVQDYQQTLVEFPESNVSVPARYARAYAWHRAAYPDRALAEATSLIEAEPRDPYFRELRGQILLESGRPQDALPDLRIATEQSRNNPLISALLGHALIATEDESNLEEARQVLRIAVQRDNRNPFAWRQLGYIYSQEGDRARAYLATAEYANLAGQHVEALRNARQAMQNIDEGSADWLRAQDIALVSEAAIDREEPRRRREPEELGTQ
ncbi:MAG: M48 family metalloprotease [Parasphingopyxis sp.]|uniref:M48 family metalloprotease n=1 Tax=Parasphingopyxis sp. TaxID=1920299 RepID=UPI0032EF7D5C